MKFFFAILAAALLPWRLAAKEPAVAPSPPPAPTMTESERLGSLGPDEVAQAISALQERHVSAATLGTNGLARATLRGLLGELEPGAELAAAETPAAPLSPFRAETLEGNVGYVRLGSLLPATIVELEGTLKDFSARKVDAIVLDLRATPETEDYDLASQVAARFVPAGTKLFELLGPGAETRKVFTAVGPRVFDGDIVVVADGTTAGAPEALAAALRHHARAMIVGGNTRGRAVEFGTLPLGHGQVLRFATAEIRIEGLPPVYPRGLQPDLEVAQAPAEREDILAGGLEKGVSSFVFERERPRMNEAALVAGTNPENEEQDYEEQPSIDRPLQRAVDLVTAIRLFRAKNK